MAKTTIPVLRIAYYDDERADDYVKVGLYEAQQAEQKFKGESQQIAAVMYQAFLGARRSKVVPDGVRFEEWIKDVAIVEPAEPGESEAPPEL